MGAGGEGFVRESVEPCAVGGKALRGFGDKFAEYGAGFGGQGAGGDQGDVCGSLRDDEREVEVFFLQLAG